MCTEPPIEPGLSRPIGIRTGAKCSDPDSTRLDSAPERSVTEIPGVPRVYPEFTPSSRRIPPGRDRFEICHLGDLGACASGFLAEDRLRLGCARVVRRWYGLGLGFVFCMKISVRRGAPARRHTRARTRTHTHTHPRPAAPARLRSRPPPPPSPRGASAWGRGRGGGDARARGACARARTRARAPTPSGTRRARARARVLGWRCEWAGLWVGGRRERAGVGVSERPRARADAMVRPARARVSSGRRRLAPPRARRARCARPRRAASSTCTSTRARS